MNDRNNVWANRQILWGWLFLIAIILLLAYLFFTFIWPRPDNAPPEDVGADVVAITVTADAQDSLRPGEQATRLADAEATLASASLRPVDSVAEVMAAAQTVVAATVEVAQEGGAAVLQTPGSDAVDVTPEPPDDRVEDKVPGLGWVDWVLGAIPGLTAMVTFVGLVVSSLMKWRTDLTSVSQARTDFEREKIQFELQKQRHELDRVRKELEFAEMALDRQRLELELDRERQATAQLRSSPDSEPRSAPEAESERDDDVESREQGDA